MSRSVTSPAVLALALMGLFAAPVAAQEAQRLISVSGTGEASAAPDSAALSVGVGTQADTAQEAVAQNAANRGSCL